MRFARLFVVAGAVVGSMLWAGSATAAPAGGKFTLYDVLQGNSNTAMVYFTGAVNDYGTQNQSNNGPGGPFVLSKGTITTGKGNVSQKVNALFNKLNPTPSTNCAVSGSTTATGKIIGGTGAYAGATGTAVVSVTVVGFAPLTSSGKCNTSNNAPFAASFFFIRATGTISFSG